MMKLVLVLSLFSVNSFALTTSKICSLLFAEEQTEVNFLISPKHGFTNRTFVGSKPERTAAAERAAMAKGGKWWGVSIAVAKTIEEAREHDKQWKSLGKIAYVISDVDVSAFDENTPKQVVQDTYRRIMEVSDVYFFEDQKDANGEELGPEHRVAVKESRNKLAIIAPAEDVIWFTGDPRGNRFHFFGWTFSKSEHGVGNFDHIYKLVETPKKELKKGMIVNPDVRRSLRYLAKFLKAGGTITFNENFEEALTLAVNTLRVGPDGKLARKSRYILDPTAFPITMQNYKEGFAYSVEARINGELKATSISLKIKNMATSDTVGYLTRGENPEGINYSDLARALGHVESMRLRKFNLKNIDVGMLTDFTKQGAGEMVPADDFDILRDKQNAQHPVELRDIVRGAFTFDQIPFAPWQYGGE